MKTVCPQNFLLRLIIGLRNSYRIISGLQFLYTKIQAEVSRLQEIHRAELRQREKEFRTELQQKNEELRQRNSDISRQQREIERLQVCIRNEQVRNSKTRNYYEHFLSHTVTVVFSNNYAPPPPHTHTKIIVESI